MSLESKVAGPGFMSARLAGVVGIFGRRAWALARSGWSQTKKIQPQPLSDSQPETLDSRPETFFDAEFLKKLERLHLIAKRLDWAGLKGEHAASRKGFSLEFSDYRRYQRGDDLRYVEVPTDRIPERRCCAPDQRDAGAGKQQGHR